MARNFNILIVSQPFSGEDFILSLLKKESDLDIFHIGRTENNKIKEFKFNPFPADIYFSREIPPEDFEIYLKLKFKIIHLKRPIKELITCLLLSNPEKNLKYQAANFFKEFLVQNKTIKHKNILNVNYEDLKYNLKTVRDFLNIEISEGDIVDNLNLLTNINLTEEQILYTDEIISCLYLETRII